MSVFSKLKNLFVSKAHDLGDAIQEKETRTKMSKNTMALATGLGFGMTLEAGLATIFGLASSGLIAVGVGAAVVYAYMNMPDQHHHHVLNLGQSAIDKLAEAIKSPSSMAEKGLQLKLDEALESQDDIALQVVSRDIHNGDIVHVTKGELDKILTHKMTP